MDILNKNCISLCIAIWFTLILTGFYIVETAGISLRSLQKVRFSLFHKGDKW